MSTLTNERSGNDTSYTMLTLQQSSCLSAILIQSLKRYYILMCRDLEYTVS